MTDISAGAAWPEHRPSETLDYSLDLTDVIDAGDSIERVAVSIAPPNEVTVRVSTGLYVLDATVTIWLEGGVAGRGVYIVRTVITTGLGRTYEALNELPIRAALEFEAVPEPEDEGFSTATVWTAP